eukprot:m.99982 g.99982  ORF g.99982 m.99982 type:complete len:215 (+) comp16770_c0_seq1:183-827(+)
MSDFDEDEENQGPSIGTYDGDRDPNTLERHGKGRAELPNGDVYEGDYENGKRHGRGVYRFKNRSCYDGEYAANKKEGTGTFWYPDGSIYEGSWADDMKSGKGTYTYANGDTYVGEWVADKKEGMGVYTYAATGAQYEGVWAGGKKHGEGTLKYSDHQFVGGFTDDQPLGPGKFSFNHGAEQHGEFAVQGGNAGADDEDTATAPKWVASNVAQST